MKIPISEYIQLCRAGYTAEEINGYCNSLEGNPATAPATTPATTPATAPATAPATTPATTPATAPATTPATAPATTPATAPAEPPENETQTMLRELLGIVRAGNINNLSVPTQPTVDPCEVMGSILSPVKSNK